MIFLIPLLIGFIIVSFWVIGFLYQTDFSIPTQSIGQFTKILLLFPHPDDETLVAGGLIHVAANQGKQVIIYTLTKGEKGNEDAHLDLNLKTVRQKEIERVARLLGADTVFVDDYGDGELSKKKNILKRKISDVIHKVKPDLLITYDRSGYYGHPDHIIVSEIITELVQKTFTDVTLWYATQPQKILKMAKLPEHMANDPAFKKRRMSPSLKIFIGWSVIAKIRALYAYQSQFYSFEKSFPLRPIPIWYFISMALFEYFYEVTKSSV